MNHANNYRIVCVFLLFFIFFSDLVQAQDWKPVCGQSITTHSNCPPPNVQTTDIFNNIYLTFMYGDSIFFPDTTIAHGPGTTGMNNCAIAKYNPSGKFIKALDIYSVPDGHVMNVYTVTDREGNLYICCEFSVRVFFLDTVINHGPGPYPSAPDIFLAKFDADFHLQWVKTISSPTQDECWGITISSDDHLYFTCNHGASGSIPETVAILGQDTIHYTSPFNSLIKTDLNGSIEWIKKIHSEYNAPTEVQLEMGQDQRIYYRGECYYNLYVDQDTLIHPIAYNGKNNTLLIAFSQNGEVDQYWFHTVRFADFTIGTDGDVFFSTSVYDTLFIGKDTITRTGNDTLLYIIGRLNQDLQPEWYHFLKKTPPTNYFYFKLQSCNDSLIFVTPADGTFRFMDSTYITSYYQRIFSGEFDPGGNLTHQNFLSSSNEMIPYFSILDNCKNILIGGTFKGTAIIGPDTIKSYSAVKTDGFIAKIERYISSINLGNDTIVCGGVVLNGPPGLELYNWNNGLSYTPELQVSQSGIYTLYAANGDNCWMSDSIFVEVIPYHQDLLGNDTVVCRKDTLLFKVEGNFKSVLWSTGDTNNSIILPGATLGVGNHLLWIQVNYGACTISDSIIISVVNNPGIKETDEECLRIHPNPANDVIHVDLSFHQPVNGILRLQNYTGVVINEISLNEVRSVRYSFHLETLSGGIYFMVFTTGDQTISRKFIIGR